MAKKEKAAVAAPKWEVKDRIYVLKNNFSPITFSLKSRGIYYFDEEKGYERELKYTTNQRTPFVDEFKGDARLSHIVFEEGSLFVPRSKQVLQKLLSLYHPLRNKIYEEFDSTQEAVDELDIIELQIEALNAARAVDIDHAEAIMRTELGNSISKMTSKEIKRDLLVFARNNPSLFLELANDENINIRNVGIKAVEQNIIKLSNDQRTFTWASNDRKLITVPFDENPYSALASYFKTDEGIEVYQSVEKRLK
tara:strand:+ start:2561 stop:3316 length:756 start_codon:yes stop_codon:yes gene_type:complete